jgi:hypothetical protein
MAFEKGCDSISCFKATLARFDMRKSIFITLGLTRLLLIGQAQARPGFVSEDIKSGADDSLPCQFGSSKSVKLKMAAIAAWIKKFAGLSKRPPNAIDAIFDQYEAPSNQNAIDCVPGWNHALPPQAGVTAGNAFMYSDPRIGHRAVRLN